MLLSESRIVMASVLLSACSGFAATQLPAPGARAISVNFASNKASLAGQSGDVGAYPVDASLWMNLDASGNTGSTPTTTVSEALTDNTGATLPATSLQVCSNGGQNYQNGSSSTLIGRLMYGYLDDGNGSNYSGFKVTGVPYKRYAVVVYFNTDSSIVTPFPAYRFNGTYYRGDSTAGTTTTATGATQYWGAKSTTALNEGGNYLVVTGLDTIDSADLTVSIPANSGLSSGHRACISGFQLIDIADPADSYTATLTGDATFSAIAWDGGKTWVDGNPNADVTLTLPPGALLTLDGALTLRSFTVISSGSVRIKNAATSLTLRGFDLSKTAALELDDQTIGWIPTDAQLLAPPPIYLYTASAGTINVRTGTFNELHATDSAAYTATYAGGTLAITGGTYTDFTGNATGTASTLIISGNPIINTGANKLEVGTMTMRVEGGAITAPQFYTTERAGSRPSTITQTGGRIILTGTGDGSSTTSATLMLGHWPSGKSVYNLFGGSLEAAEGGLRLGNDSPADLTISGGLLIVTDIKGKGTNAATLTLSGGELRIGAGGFAAFNNCTFTLAGGTLTASASNTIAQPAIVAEETTSTLKAVSGATMKLSSITGDGTLALAEGIFEISSAVMTPITVAEGAVLRVMLNATEVSTIGKVMSNVTLPAGQSIIFLNPDGSEIDSGVSGNAYTPASSKIWNTASGTWSVGDSPANWSDNAAFADGNSILFRDQPNPAAITVAGTVAPATLSIAGGNLTFTGGNVNPSAALIKTELGTATFNQPVVPAKIQIDRGQLSFTSTLGNGGSFGSASQTLTLAKDTTLHLDIPAETTQVMTAANRSGSGTILKTGPGTLHLTENNNAAFSGTVRIAEGTLLLNKDSSSGPLYRNVIEVAGANSVVELTSKNAVTWSGAAEPQRMILKEGATMLVKARNPIYYKWEISDATIHVTGGEGSINDGTARGLDFYYTNTLNVEAAEGATAEEPTVSRITGETGNQYSAASIRGYDAPINVAENARLDIEIPVRNVETGRGFIKNGPGTLRFSGGVNAYTGATVINAGIVEVINNSSLGVGAVTLAGNTTLKLNALDADQTLANTAISGTGTIEKYGDMTSTITCAVSNTVALATNEGTLELFVAEGINYPLPMTNRSGSGTLLKSGPGELRLTGTKAGVGPLRATAGTLTFDFSGTQGPLYGNTIEVSGEGTTLRLPNQNSTAYDATGTQRLIAKDGATIRFEARSAVWGDVWELCGANIDLVYATTDGYPRCLDLYQGPTLTVSAAEGATAQNPTVSRIIDSASKGGGASIRERDATIDVAANARLEIAVPVTRYDAGKGLVKRGSGTLLLANANNTYSGATAIEAGTFLLNGNHTGAGDYTLAEGATLGGTGALTLADGKSLTFAKASRFVRLTEVLEDGLTLTGTLVLPEIETESDRITVDFNPVTMLKRGQPYYLIKTALPADAASRFKSGNVDLKINQNATGLFIYQPAGLLITLY